MKRTGQVFTGSLIALYAFVFSSITANAAILYEQTTDQGLVAASTSLYQISPPISAPASTTVTQFKVKMSGAYEGNLSFSLLTSCGNLLNAYIYPGSITGTRWIIGTNTPTNYLIGSEVGPSCDPYYVLFSGTSADLYFASSTTFGYPVVSISVQTATSSPSINMTYPENGETMGTTTFPIQWDYNLPYGWDHVTVVCTNYTAGTGTSSSAFRFDWDKTGSGSEEIPEATYPEGQFSCLWTVSGSNDSITFLSSFVVIHETDQAFGFDPDYIKTMTGDTVEYDYCGIDRFNLKWCLYQSVIPSSAQIQLLYGQATTSLLRRMPIGYAYRIKELFDMEATSTLPNLVLTVPTGLIGAGKSVDLTPWSHLMGPTSEIAKYDIGTKSAPDFLRDAAFYLCGIGIIFYLIRRIPRAFSSGGGNY